MWEVELYENRNGRVPVEDFLNSLSSEDRVLILHGFSRLEEHGNQLARPHSAPLRNGLYELRIHAKNIQVRFIYFFLPDKIIVVTHGFIKKVLKVPQNEIDLALKYRADYLARNR